MEGLYYSTTELTDHIQDVLPSKEPVLVENILLDGTPHVQTVGTALTVLDITLFATDVNKEIIDGYIASATLLTINWLDRYATGYIRSVPKWQNAGYLYYSTTMQMAVLSEGDQE